MVFNFREGEYQSQIASVLSEYDMTVIDYPRQYEGCPLLNTEMIHLFLKSCENWFSLGPQNMILMHSERGGLPVLVFMLAALLLYRKQLSGEKKTLEMIYKQAPRELLHLMSPLNPLPSQLRYLQYVSGRNVGSEWPPSVKALTLDCIILRFIPNMDGEGGCRPIFRIYGQDPSMAGDRTPKVLFSTPKNSKLIRYYKQVDSELVKINTHCQVAGDVVLECISLDSVQERELMMFRIMFNTAFIRSNILMLNREEIDTLWNTKDQFPKDFSAEVIFSDMDVATPAISIDLPGIEEKDGLPIDDFAKVQDVFSKVDYTNAANMLQENFETGRPKGAKRAKVLQDNKVKEKSNLPTSEHTTTSPTSDALENQSIFSFQSSDGKSSRNKFEPQEIQDAPQKVAQHTPSAESPSDKSSIEGKTESQELQVAPHEAEHSKNYIKPSIEANPSIRNVKIQYGLPIDDFANVQDVFSKVDYTSVANMLQENLETGRPKGAKRVKVSHDDKVKEKSNLLTSEHIITSPTSDALEKQSIFSFQSSDENSSRNEFQPQEIQVAPQKAAQHTPSAGSPSDSSSIEGKTESQEFQVVPHEAEHSKNYIKPSAEANPSIRNVEVQKVEVLPPQPAQSTLSFSPVLDVNSTRKKIEPQELQVAVQRPAQPKIISQQSPQSSISSAVSYSNSSQSSSVPISRYCSATSALLHDRDVSESEDRSHAVEDSDTSPTSAYQPPSFLEVSPPAVKSTFQPPPPPPQLPSFSAISPSSTIKNSFPAPPPPPLPSVASSTTCSISSSPQFRKSGPPPPGKSSVPQSPPPPPPSLAAKGPSSNSSAHVPPVPPPPAPCTTSPQLHSASNGSIPPIPRPPSNPKGRSISLSRIGPKNLAQQRKTNLKPYHWLKLTKAMQGSLWAEAQKPEEASKAPEIDMLELESLFSTAAENPDDSRRDGKSNRGAPRRGPEKVQLIELRRAYNCEIMLTKIKISLPELTSSVLTLDDTALDSDQLENLIKFCPTKEEAELLQGYKGDTDKLGKCEQLKRQENLSSSFHDQLKSFFVLNHLSFVPFDQCIHQVRNSVKLKRIMQTILSLGNALNRGTARGSAVGFRLDSLLKLSETRSRDNKMTLMHYLCKILDEKLPELLYFPQDLESLEASTKIQLKFLAEEMQSISKGLEKVIQELAASENDGPVSATFCLNLKEFLGFAEGEVRSLALLYSSVGRNADALSLYFGEDPARCTFEQANMHLCESQLQSCFMFRVLLFYTFLLFFFSNFSYSCVHSAQFCEDVCPSTPRKPQANRIGKQKAHKADNEKLKVSTPAKKSEHLI
ncbi:hypothetical protein V6N12_072255 [Hibiscus sabdariffa]|uniref:Formin-like protein n=1 Tax=Hibiscus sabdariffa TaxID=183260 RepID=A0ABR2FM68_9ROSI